MIDTDAFSQALRRRAIDLANRRVLITDLRGSQQEHDLTAPINCAGVGRIRHFRRRAASAWLPNPLPIDPASRALGTAPAEELTAQVFQIAACNWRCWYCFVDFPLLAADPKHARWLSASELVDLYLAEAERPHVIDLTGGQPDLVPEWVVWIMRELVDRGLDSQVYLWSDDNLSNDYFWRFLGDADLEPMGVYRLYGKVGCFKGFNPASFAFNTGAHPALYDRQFQLMGRLLSLGLDQYAYVTFTSPMNDGIRSDIGAFVDQLQRLDHYLPLRTIPLEIQRFTPTESRIARDPPAFEGALANQRRALEAWLDELERRFSTKERSLNIVDVPLRQRARRG